jgi:hypothetical protein
MGRFPLEAERLCWGHARARAHCGHRTQSGDDGEVANGGRRDEVAQGIRHKHQGITTSPRAWLGKRELTILAWRRWGGG